MPTEFFASSATRDALSRALKYLDSPATKKEIAADVAHHLRTVLNSMHSNPAEWDQNTSLNIGWIGGSLHARLMNLEKGDPGEPLLLLALCYRFLTELELSIKGELVEPLLHVRNFVLANTETWSEDPKGHSLYATYHLPISLMKGLLGSDAIGALKDWQSKSDSVEAKLTAWQTELDARQKTTSDLADTLSRYETAFNFVGLYQGFDELSVAKKKQLRNETFSMQAFGLLALIPLGLEIAFIAKHLDSIDKFITILITSAIPLVSVTFIMLYYFRIALHTVEATKSQLLQIELRKTLCRFIQSYATYTGDMNEKAKEALGKFENIIFSSIMPSDSKIPATFDGVEQLATLIKSARGS